MKTDSKKFQDALATVSKIVSTRHSLPILATVLIRAEGGKMSIRASDLDQDQTEIIDCEGSLAPLCVSARLLGDVVRVAGPEITFEATKERLSVQSRGSASLGYLAVEEYPKAPEDKFKPLAVNVADLVESIKAVAWAQSDELQGRPALCAVHIITDATHIECEATAGRHYALHKKPSICANSNFTVYRPFVDRFCDALEKPGAIASIGERYLRVQHESGSYFCKRSEEKYPSTKGFVTETTHLGSLPREEALSVASLCVRIAGDQIFPSASLEFGDNGAELSFTAKDGNSYKQTIGGKFKKFSAKIGLGSTVAILSNSTADKLEVYADPEDFISPIKMNGGELTTVMGQMRSK